MDIELNNLCCVEEYTNSQDIKFRYVLSTEEKEKLSNIIYDVLNKFKSPKETIPFVKSNFENFNNIFNSLNYFFSNNKDKYFFLRISTLSPKDAWYQLCSETPQLSDDIENESISIDEIKRDINLLKVNNAEQCILILCHSLRIYYELEFDKCKNNSILLLEWKNDILHDTETRCFIKNNKLLVFTQYYELDNGYLSMSQKTNMDNIYKSIIAYINKYIVSSKNIYKNFVMDIAFSSNLLDINNLIDHIIFIEINPFNKYTDSSLFEWKEIDNYNSNNIEFRYKMNKEIKIISTYKRNE